MHSARHNPSVESHFTFKIALLHELCALNPGIALMPNAQKRIPFLDKLQLCLKCLRQGLALSRNAVAAPYAGIQLHHRAPVIIQEQPFAPLHAFFESKRE